MNRFIRFAMCVFVVVVIGVCSLGTAAEPVSPTRIVAHRGLLLHSPENTLANFTACLNLRLGFEFDVQRAKDGELVCIHDDTVDRTTDGKGRVSEMTVAELSKLDAGAWFGPAFSGGRIPTVDAVFALLAKHPTSNVLVTVDLKAADVEQDTVRLAQRNGVLDRVLFIGRAITESAVRKRLREADPHAHVAALAQTSADLSAAIAETNADWVYVRFVPTPAEVAQVRAADKRVLLSGPLVSGHDVERWRQAATAGVDAILTDYALECAAQMRKR